MHKEPAGIDDGYSMSGRLNRLLYNRAAYHTKTTRLTQPPPQKTVWRSGDRDLLAEIHVLNGMKKLCPFLHWALERLAS